jgi:hypothetical protein
MRSVSIKQFRSVCWLALLCVGALFLPRLGLVTFSKGIAAARTWSYFEHILPVWAIRAYSVAWYLAVVAGLIGLLLFWRPSRWILAMALLSAIAVRPFLGLSVHSAYEAFVATVGGYGVIWLTAVSFWSPLAENFVRRQA